MTSVFCDSFPILLGYLLFIFLFLFFLLVFLSLPRWFGKFFPKVFLCILQNLSFGMFSLIAKQFLIFLQVQNNLCTPKNGEILVASTQDFLTSSFLITRKDTFYDRATFSLMCSYMGDAMDSIDLPTPVLIKVCFWCGSSITFDIESLFQSILFKIFS